MSATQSGTVAVWTKASECTSRLSTHWAFSGAAQFRNEAEVLGKYRHPNIVALLGTAEVRHEESGVGRPCLVYEFMPGASLGARLHPRPGTVAAGPPLSPRERFCVASDVARGLMFLHTVCDPPIIHQDIKSANILLGAAGRGSEEGLPGLGLF